MIVTVFKANRVITVGELVSITVFSKGFFAKVRNPDDGNEAVIPLDSMHTLRVTNEDEILTLLPASFQEKQSVNHFQQLYQDWFDKRRKKIGEN